MAFVGTRVTVTDTATALESAVTSEGVSVLIRNRGSVAVYIGGSAVTTSTGYQLDPGEAITVEADEVNPLGAYGIVASGTAVCHILRVGV